MYVVTVRLPPKLELPKDTEALCAVPGRTSEAGKPTMGSRRQMKGKWAEPQRQRGRTIRGQQIKVAERSWLLSRVAGQSSGDIQKRRERGERGLRTKRKQRRLGRRGSPPGRTTGLAAALQGQAALCRQEVADGAAPQSCPCRWAGPQWLLGQKGQEKSRAPLQALPTLAPLPALTSAGMRPRL